METSRSPWKVMREAHRLASLVFPKYSHPCSRHDFTLAQLFACLVVREMLKLGYRKTEALLRDSPHWLRDLGMSKAPDHNTLWRAFGTLVATHQVSRMLDLLAELFAKERQLKLSLKPLTIDSTCYEPRHRSRHYDRVCRKMRLPRQGAKYEEMPERSGKPSKAQVDQARSRSVRGMPKLALAVAAGCHLILAARVHIGNGSDNPDFGPLLRSARRRAAVKVAVADAGYDSEQNHMLARLDLKVRSIIPPRIGRPSSKPPAARFRRLMHQRFARDADQRHYGQRAQSETVNSMMKRNLGDALRSIRPKRREQEMLLRVITHNVMLRCALEGG
ncbi:MAG: transposase [Tepidisphaeraceae bacterium]